MPPFLSGVGSVSYDVFHPTPLHWYHLTSNNSTFNIIWSMSHNVFHATPLTNWYNLTFNNLTFNIIRSMSHTVFHRSFSLFHLGVFIKIFVCLSIFPVGFNPAKFCKYGMTLYFYVKVLISSFWLKLLRDTTNSFRTDRRATQCGPAWKSAMATFIWRLMSSGEVRAAVSPSVCSM